MFLVDSGNITISLNGNLTLQLNNLREEISGKSLQQVL